MKTAMKASAKKRPARKKKSTAYLPQGAGEAFIDGKKFILFPDDAFDDWCEDMILFALAKDRMEHEGENAIPAEEVFAKLGRNGKRGKCTR